MQRYSMMVVVDGVQDDKGGMWMMNILRAKRRFILRVGMIVYTKTG